MRIAKIVLHNVKSYADTTTVELTSGINAICGENGAGKSTLLEALGFALFGYRPYKLDAFLREGEKSGSITVTVEDDDGCTFHIVRKLGSGSGHAVYDELQQRLAEGDADVRAWLLDFFRLEPGTDLAKLFEDTVGPPQGTLTAIFLESAGPRGKKFDRLLGIEDYPAAAQSLRAVGNIFRDQATEAERQAALLEGDARRLPEVETHQREVRDRVAELGIALAAQQREQATLVAERDRWDRAQQAVQRAEADFTTVEGRAAQAHQRLGEQATELAHAEEAALRVEASREGHSLYTEASNRLKGLNLRRQERDRLRQSAEMAGRAALKAEQELLSAEKRLAELDGDEAHAAELETLVPEQERREAALRQVEDRVRAHQEAARQLPTVEERLATARKRLREAEARLSEVDGARPLAAGLEGLRQRDLALREELTRLRQQGWTLQQTIEGLAEAEARLQKLSLQAEQLRSEAEGLRPVEAVAREAGARQERRDALHGQTETLRARHAEAERSRNQVGDGLCPLLREPCGNLRAGVSLAAHFETLAVGVAAELARSKGELAQAERALAEARSAEKVASRLPLLEERLRQMADERTRLEGEIARLEAVRVELAGTPSEQSRVQEELRRLEPALAEAEAARQVVAGEAGWRSQAEEAAQSAEREQQALVQLRALLEREAGAASDLAAAKTALAGLKDPRGQAAALRQRIVRTRPDLERLLERSRRDAAGAHAAEARATQALEPFALLEEEMAAATRLRDEHEAAYRDFLAHQAEAGRLAQRRNAHARAAGDLERARADLESARKSLEALRAGYQEAEHARVRLAVDELAGKLASSQRELELCLLEEERIIQEIELLRQRKAQMEAAQGEAAECRGLMEAVEAIRRALDAAGPEIARALLRRISARATGIYRDLLGQPAVSIEWGSDYEIRCRIRADEREFKQLSGGEQMAAALAVRLALLQTLSNLRLAFLDEPTAHMDALRRANLAAQIQNLRSFDQLVVISHDDSFDTLFGHVVRLAKRDGATVIEP